MEKYYNNIEAVHIYFCGTQKIKKRLEKDQRYR